MTIIHKDFYSACNLTENPFRTNSSADADPRRGIWIGYEKQRETIYKFLLRTLADRVGNINFLLIYGELGVGKSHALLWSHYQILQAQKADFDSVAYYIPTLLKDKAKMSFATAFKEDIVGKSNMVSDILQYKQFVLERVVEYKQENGMGPDVSTEKAAEYMVPSMEMMNVLRQILKCENEGQVRELLNPAGDHAAVLLFCRIANLFIHSFSLKSGKRLFKKATYLFIDEVDELAKVSAKEAREVNGHFRHIYDMCPNCFFLGLGFTATAAELNVLFDEYVMDRVSKSIVLDFLQPEEAKEFVKAILNTARVDSRKKKDYFPFTEDAIKTILAGIVSITPRKVVTIMQQVIEECRLAGLDPSKGAITADAMDKAGIWEMIR